VVTMRYVVREHEGWFSVETSGEPDVVVWRSFFEELLARPHWRRGGRLLVDHTRLELGRLSIDEVRLLSEVAKEYGERFGAARLAVLVDTDVKFGVVRMTDVYFKGKWEVVALTFRDRDEALAWLLDDGD